MSYLLTLSYSLLLMAYTSFYSISIFPSFNLLNKPSTQSDTYYFYTYFQSSSSFLPYSCYSFLSSSPFSYTFYSSYSCCFYFSCYYCSYLCYYYCCCSFLSYTISSVLLYYQFFASSSFFTSSSFFYSFSYSTYSFL